MAKELIEKKGFEIEGHPRKLFISTQELISHGCKNCMWRLHNQCPHAITEANKFYEFSEETSTKEKGIVVKGIVKHTGYCMEYVNFILRFAEDTGSVSSMWEKFALYVMRIQSVEDYSAYMEASKELARKRAGNPSGEELAKLVILEEHLHLWWERSNEAVTKYYSKISDRESKSRDAGKSGPNIMGDKPVDFKLVKKKEE